MRDDRTWKDGAFQCGVNKDGKIGTWCSERCFIQYQKLSPSKETGK